MKRLFIIAFLLFGLPEWAWAQKVTWTCPTCTPTSGTASGTASWTITGIGLALGPNSFVVTATDAKGLTNTDTITVTRVSANAVTITSPVPGPQYITTNGNQVFTGTSTCDGGAVPDVSWVNDKGGGGKMTTSPDWGVTATLTPNTINTIDVTSTCPTDPKVSTARLRIAYSPPVSLLEMSFDENSGTTPQDVSGLNNDGTFGAGVAYTSTAQKFGLSALDFSGGSLAVTSTSIQQQIIGGFAVVAWVNPDTSATTTWRAIAVNNYSEFLYQATPGTGAGTCQAGVPVGGFVSGATNYFVCPTTPLPPTTYSCVAITYDGTALTMYVNKTAVATVPMAYQFPNAPASGVFQIGGSQYPEQFDGKIDEVRFRQYGMSAAEVATACDTQIGGGPPAPASALKIGSVGVRVGSEGIAVGY